MGSSVSAIAYGLDYQAYLFWLEAARLLIHSNRYHSVGFELDAPKSLDDVAIFHQQAKLDCRGDEYDTEYLQVKYHTDQRSAITAESLIDPAFIGATSESFLQKVVRARTHALSANQKPKFFLVSPWNIDTGNALGNIVSGNEGEIHLHKLFDNTTDRSGMGKVRKLWRDHLKLKTDDDLIEILKPIRIRQNGHNLYQVKRSLSDVLGVAGLCDLDDSRRTDPYPQLVRKLRAEGKSIFDRRFVHDVCTRENLIRVIPSGETATARRIGIRSFYRFAEDMESETERMISLLHYFNGRPIKDPALWMSKIVPEIKALMESELSQLPKALEFHLDTHVSCAFVAGYLLDPKAGVDVTISQKTMAARQIWRFDSSGQSAKSRIRITEDIKLDRSNADVAIAISITQMTFADVVSYVKSYVPTVERVCRFEIDGDAGNSRVECGSHATALAEQIRNLLKEIRADMKPEARLHIFIAAPNALVFFLARLLRPLGRIQLYEHSFDGSLPKVYAPSLELNTDF